MIVEFTLGDWSDDGHGRKETYHAEISGFFTLPSVRAAYEKGKADLGFGIENIADEYGEYTISDEQWNELVKDGFIYSYDGYIPEGENAIAHTGLDERVYLEIFEYIVKKHLPEFKAVMHYPSRYPSLWGPGEIIDSDFVGYGPLGPY